MGLSSLAAWDKQQIFENILEQTQSSYLVFFTCDYYINSVSFSVGEASGLVFLILF
jgi:hypothetical protein